ncbi:hypothetical protein [Photorhabdus akhurstii]|uniref:hypothetical protein n=1 Tax=Photorhabdus akhurstii TaxID=171438 RepID=UPI001BD36F8F|nr:hypothetical protein [Photorhabdus akhurstii]MBS9430656.1 hypothetical protein [Photorhabdus akhurstii]
MVKTLCRLKPEIKKMTFNSSLKPAHHKYFSEKQERMGFINIHIPRKKEGNHMNNLIRQSIFPKEWILITFLNGINFAINQLNSRL